tara:strand:- start:410 stop:832 length:423 start_codon:yes stop_codon:yes gene_type:complete
MSWVNNDTHSLQYYNLNYIYINHYNNHNSGNLMIQYNATLNNYILTIDNTDIPCHNRATAEYLLSAYTEARPAVSTKTETTQSIQLTLEEIYGCILGGLGRHTPAITWTLTGRVERCHNWATAQTIVNDNENDWGTKACR